LLGDQTSIGWLLNDRIAGRNENCASTTNAASMSFSDCKRCFETAQCAAPMALVEPGTPVFVIDDDAEIRHSLADLLIMEGYQVRTWSSAEAAWNEIARGAQPALIVLDLWLPGTMSSGELVRRLRASAHRAVPVLVLSGSSSAAHVESDVDAVRQKPIEATTLVRTIDELVRRGPRRGPQRTPARSRSDLLPAARSLVRARRPRSAGSCTSARRGRPRR
jgi:CheY-like chemotaxis protein